MKRTILSLCVMREILKILIVLTGIVFITLPEAWIENGKPLIMVLLTMAGCAAIICGLWNMERRAEYRVFCLRRKRDRAVQWEQEKPLREAQRRRAWQRWMKEQQEA